MVAIRTNSYTSVPPFESNFECAKDGKRIDHTRMYPLVLLRQLIDNRSPAAIWPAVFEETPLDNKTDSCRPVPLVVRHIHRECIYPFHHGCARG